MQQVAIPAPPRQAPPPSVQPPQLVLVGIITSEQRGAAAVVLDTASRTSFSLRAGDTYQGWTVRSLGKDGVVLRMQDQTVTLTFPAGPPGPGTAPGSPPQTDD